MAEKKDAKPREDAELAKTAKSKKPAKSKKLEKELKPKEEKAQAKKIEPAIPVIDHFNVIKFVLMTEKSIQNIEKENKLVFIVNRKATKKQISDAVRSAFNTATASVRTSIDQKGRKKAFVRFAKAGEAGDIAVRLGII